MAFHVVNALRLSVKDVDCCLLCTSRSSKGENLLNDLVLYAVEAKREKNNIEDDHGTEESIKIVVINSK